MQLTKELKREKNARVTVRVTVDKTSVNESMQAIVQELERRSKIPGFRKGKVPKSLVLSHFSKYIKEETVNKVLSGSLEQVLKEESCRPITEPVVVEMGDLGEDRDFSFRAEFDVMPEVTLPEYKGVASDKYSYTVRDEDVERELEGLRERYANLVDKEGKSEDGDYLVVDYEEYDDRDAVVGRKQTQTVLLDVRNDELSRELLGLSKGDEKVVSLPLKGDGGKTAEPGKPGSTAAEEEEKASGGEGHSKPGRLRVLVKEVKRKALPALGDDFARDVSDLDTLESLKKRIREELDKTALERSEEKTKEELIGKLVEATSIELPLSLVDSEVTRLLANIAVATRIDPAKLYKDEATLKEYRKDLTPRAVRNVKHDLIMNEIAKREQIDVSEREMDEEIEKYAKAGKRDPASVRETMTNNRSLDQLRYRLRQNKALNLVYENAKLGKVKELRLDEGERSE